MWSIWPHIDRHKCGKIPCLKNRRKIQTGGKLKARSYSYNMFLAYWVLGGLMSFIWSVLIAYRTAVGFVVLCVVISVFFYTKIFLRLQQHQTQVEHVHQGQPNRQGNHLIITQYKRTVYSIAWVQLAMVVCYVPFIISTIIRTVEGGRSVSAEIFEASTATLLYFNRSLNPILYCWKITEVRQAVKDTVKQFCCSSS